MNFLHRGIPGMKRTRLVLLPCVIVHVPLLDLPFNIRIVTELALIAFLAGPSLVKHAKYSLRVYPKRYLLRLYGLQESSFLLSPFLVLGFLFLSKGFFPLLFESCARFAGRFLLFLDSGHLFLDFRGSVFLLLHR